MRRILAVLLAGFLTIPAMLIGSSVAMAQGTYVHSHHPTAALCEARGKQGLQHGSWDSYYCQNVNGIWFLNVSEYCPIC